MQAQIQTGPECLAATLRHHGLDGSAGRLTAEHAIRNEGVGFDLMLRMARDSGLKARRIKLKPDAIVRLGQAFPALARLENGNWVSILGADQDDTGATLLRLFDPLASLADRLRSGWNNSLSAGVANCFSPSAAMASLMQSSRSALAGFSLKSCSRNAYSSTSPSLRCFYTCSASRRLFSSSW